MIPGTGESAFFYRKLPSTLRAERSNLAGLKSRMRFLAADILCGFNTSNEVISLMLLFMYLGNVELLRVQDKNKKICML